MEELLYLLLFLGVWIGTLVYAYRTRREHFWTFFVLCLIGGPLGFMIGVLIINTPSGEELEESDEGVHSCPSCGWLYKPEDYREDAAIICKGCSSTLREPDRQ